MFEGCGFGMFCLVWFEGDLWYFVVVGSGGGNVFGVFWVVIMY